MNIDKLKQVIQEANPEIMELKFGCQIECDDGRIKSSTGGSDCDNNAYTPDNLEIAGTFKILGRPIRLADVLAAMGAEKRFAYDSDRTTSCNHRCGQDILLDGWRLKDNNLDNQSEATKQFLIDILVK